MRNSGYSHPSFEQLGPDVQVIVNARGICACVAPLFGERESRASSNDQQNARHGVGLTCNWLIEAMSWRLSIFWSNDC